MLFLPCFQLASLLVHSTLHKSALPLNAHCGTIFRQRKVQNDELPFSLSLRARALPHRIYSSLCAAAIAVRLLKAGVLCPPPHQTPGFADVEISVFHLKRKGDRKIYDGLRRVSPTQYYPTRALTSAIDVCKLVHTHEKKSISSFAGHAGILSGVAPRRRRTAASCFDALASSESASINFTDIPLSPASYSVSSSTATTITATLAHSGRPVGRSVDYFSDLGCHCCL